MRVLNWKPSPKDERDFKFALNFSLLSEEELPRMVDLRPLIPEIWDQGQLGSCVGHSTGMAVLYQSRKQNREINPSRLFLYYNARAIQGWQREDSGCYIRDCFKTLNKEGVCKNDTWPYVEKEVFTKPSEKSYKEGLDTTSTKYYRVGQSILEMKNCLANGRPFVFGFEVFTSFMNGNWTDTMPTPKQNEKSLGGHAVCLTPDNMVITESGVKTIDTISKLDKVLTRQGFKSVKEISVREVDEDILFIHSPLTVKPLSVTKEHPVLRQKSKKSVKLKHASFKNLSFVEAKDLEKYDVISSVIDQTEVDNEDISEDFARLLGYYIGDGNLQIEYYNESIKSCKFRISYHRYCKKNIIEDAINIIEKEYPGTKYSIWESKDSLSNNITFYNTELGKKILKYCGKAKEKTIDSLLQLPKNKQLEILKGWFKTDGSGEWLKDSSIHTSEYSLAHSLIILLQRNRLIYSSTVIESKDIIIRGRNAKRKESYTISFHEKRNKVRMYYKDNMVYSRVSLIEETPYIGNVYNLQVDSVEEYVANNVLVHNCAVGYDDDKKCFLIKNSWGSDWKMKGYFWMPYSYIITNRCDDFWTLESLKEVPTPEPIPEPVPEPTPTGCLDPFKLFTSVSELKSLSKTLLFKVATLMGLKPLNTSKTTLLNLLQQELKLK